MSQRIRTLNGLGQFRD